MPKYLILKHYRGGPEAHHEFPPMDQWAPEDVDAHLAFLGQTTQMLRDTGELVEGRALTPDRVYVRWDGPDAAPVTTDGPYPETSDLVAGWYLVDVESYERAIEIASHVSQGPGPDGVPIREWLEVRRVMDDSPADD